MPNAATHLKRRFAAAASRLMYRDAPAARRRVTLTVLAAAAVPLGWVVAARGAQQFGLGLGIGAGEPAMARYVTAGDDAFLLGEPELLAGPLVTQVSLSPDERYAFAVRERTDLAAAASALAQGDKPTGEYGEISIITWNRRTRRASVAWKAPRATPLATQISRAEWLPGTSLLYVTIAQLSADGAGGHIDEAAVYLVNAANGSARRVAALNQTDDKRGYTRLFVSPTYPFAAMETVDLGLTQTKREEKIDTVRVLNAAGTLGAAVSLPTGSGLIAIGPKGDTVYAIKLAFATDPKTGKETRKVVYYAVSVATGEAKELPGEADLSDKEAETEADAIKAQITALPIGLADGDGVARRKTTALQSLHSVWLAAQSDKTAVAAPPTSAPNKAATTTATGKPATPLAPPGIISASALLSPQTTLVVADADAEGLTDDAVNRRSWDETGKMDARGARLLADGNAVLYRDRSGALFLRPIVRVNKAAFIEARKQALRAQTLSNGKQIALGVLMYVQDYDEVFPPPGGATQIQIGPYLKNEDLFLNTLTGEPGFTYVGGGSMAAIEEVAKTPIGYLTGPGGRVIIYADGHVKWE